MILIKPYITEKTLAATVLNRYTFLVDPKANKNQIKQAVEAAFNVNVVKINTKTRRSLKKRNSRTGKYTRTPVKKIAQVELKSAQSITLFETKAE